MKLTIFLSITLISLLSYAEAVPGKTHNNAVACQPQCGVDGSSLIACSILEFFVIFVGTVCELLKIIKQIGPFVACLASLLTPPFDTMLTSIINGVVEGADWTLNACPGALQIYKREVITMCPNIFATVDGVLGHVFGVL